MDLTALDYCFARLNGTKLPIDVHQSSKLCLSYPLFSSNKGRVEGCYGTDAISNWYDGDLNLKGHVRSLLRRFNKVI